MDFVSQPISRLKPNKATGLDIISARLLKDGCHDISPVLAPLINRSIEDGVFPKIWKSAKVTALFKGGDMLVKDNYRPISILPKELLKEQFTYNLVRILSRTN